MVMTVMMLIRVIVFAKLDRHIQMLPSNEINQSRTFAEPHCQGPSLHCMKQVSQIVTPANTAEVEELIG
jgi:hypothetical protein